MSDTTKMKPLDFEIMLTNHHQRKGRLLNEVYNTVTKDKAIRKGLFTTETNSPSDEYVVFQMTNQDRPDWIPMMKTANYLPVRTSAKNADKELRAQLNTYMTEHQVPIDQEWDTAVQILSENVVDRVKASEIEPIHMDKARIEQAAMWNAGDKTTSQVYDVIPEKDASAVVDYLNDTYHMGKDVFNDAFEDGQLHKIRIMGRSAKTGVLHQAIATDQAAMKMELENPTELLARVNGDINLTELPGDDLTK